MPDRTNFSPASSSYQAASSFSFPPESSNIPNLDPHIKTFFEGIMAGMAEELSGSSGEIPMAQRQQPSHAKLRINPRNAFSLTLANLRELQLYEAKETGIVPPLGEVLRRFCFVEELELTNISSEELLSLKDTIKGLKRLTSITISDPKITEVDFLADLNNLTRVSLNHCDSLQRLPQFTLGSKLTNLRLEGCRSLTSLDGLSCPNLKELTLSYCSRLVSIEGLQNCFNMEYLKIVNCPSLPNLQALSDCSSLERLTLESCFSLQTFEATHIPNLSSLLVRDCLNLSSCNGLICPNLKEAFLSGCKEISSIEDLFSQRLETLYLKDCPSLTTFGVDSLPINLKKLSLYATGICDWEIADLKERSPNLSIVGESGATAWATIFYGIKKLKKFLSALVQKFFSAF